MSFSPKNLADLEYQKFIEGAGQQHNVAVLEGYPTAAYGLVSDPTGTASGTTLISGTVPVGSVLFIEQVILSAHLAQQVYLEDNAGTPNKLSPTFWVNGSAHVDYKPKPYIKLAAGAALNMVRNNSGTTSISVRGRYAHA